MIREVKTRKHPAVSDRSNLDAEHYVLHLIHRKAYEYAASQGEHLAIVDWACNDGYGLEILQSAAKLLVGIDVDVDLTLKAKHRTGEAALVVCFDGEQCPLRSNCFDLLTSFQVIEHIIDIPNYLSEARRILSTSGTALFTTPNSLIRLDPGMAPWNDHHVREFDACGFEQCLLSAFDDVTVLGLRGSPQLEEVERRRVHTRRQTARANIEALNRCRRLLAAQFSDYEVRGLSIFLTPVQSRSWDMSFVSRLSTSDLCYTRDRVEDALDLLAICKGPKPC